MPSVEGTIMKKVLPILYVIDTSGSMQGQKIAAVNEAMHESMEILKEKSADSPDAEIKVGVLLFSSGATWKTKNGLVSLEDFGWDDLTASGLTDLHLALKELGKKLSRKEFLKSETGFNLPVIIFMSDGAPTDESWEKELNKLRAENKWFSRGRKVAIAIGEDAELSTLGQLCGTMEAVIQSNDLEALKNCIVQVSVSSSMLASQSRMVGDEASGAAILKDAVANIEGEAETFEDTSDFFEETGSEDALPTAAPVSSSSDDWSDDGWD